MLLMVASGGAEGHDAHINWWTLGSMMVNAILFFGFLAIKLRPVVSNGLVARRENMAKQLEEARAQQAEAEKRLDEYKAKLDNLESEVDRIVKSYENEAEADRRRMSEEADRAIQRLVRETEFTLGQEVKKAEKIIREAAVSSTLEAAEEILTRSLTEADQKRLAEEYIARIEVA
jgi:F-type H+-transporting ATPase subunit b